MESMNRKMTFSINGEFITRIAREWFFIEHKPYEKVEELLLSCMCGTDTPEGTLKLMAQDIILGKAEFRGNSGDDTFRYVILDEPAGTNIFTEFSRICQENHEYNRRNRDMYEKYMNIYDALTLWVEDECEAAIEIIEDKSIKEMMIRLMERYDELESSYVFGGSKELTFKDSGETMYVSAVKTGNNLVDDYIQQKVIEHKFDDNYGWLDPKGEFHPVEFGYHQAWAYQTALEMGYINEEDSWMTGDDGDILVERGWALLHNPSMGVAYVTRNKVKPLTKAQREFLFDYYTERGLAKKAKEYFEEE